MLNCAAKIDITFYFQTLNFYVIQQNKSLILKIIEF